MLKLNRISIVLALLSIAVLILSYVANRSSHAQTSTLFEEKLQLVASTETAVEHPREENARPFNEDDEEEEVDEEEDGDRENDDDDDEEEREHEELEFEVAHMELERVGLEVGLVGLEMFERLTEIAVDEVSAAAYAIMRITEFLEPEEAAELLEESLEDAPPVIQRLIRMQLLEIYASTDQHDKIKQQLRSLINNE